MFLEILLLVVMIILFGYIFYQSVSILLSPTTLQSVNNHICFSENCFIVEVAKTEAERNKGLMYRKELAEDMGMFFIFEKEGLYPFWMKNTLIPLDMIWIRENPSTGSGRVVYIARNIQPCKSLICPAISPNVKAKYVLEINANVSEKLKIKVGDIVEIKIR